MRIKFYFRSMGRTSHLSLSNKKEGRQAQLVYRKLLRFLKSTSHLGMFGKHGHYIKKEPSNRLSIQLRCSTDNTQSLRYSTCSRHSPVWSYDWSQESPLCSKQVMKLPVRGTFSVSRRQYRIRLDKHRKAGELVNEVQKNFRFPCPGENFSLRYVAISSKFSSYQSIANTTICGKRALPTERKAHLGRLILLPNSHPRKRVDIFRRNN